MLSRWYSIFRQNFLAHDIFLQVLAITCLGRLVFNNHFSYQASLFLTIIIVNLYLVIRHYYYPNNNTLKLRLSIGFISVVIIYFLLKGTIAQLVVKRYDTVLLAFDNWLVDGNLSVMLQPIINPYFTELFSACYLLFFIYFIRALIRYISTELNLTIQFYIGFISVVAIGFLFYTLIPAAGPYIAFPKMFLIPLTGGWITQFTQLFVTNCSNFIDVFPSLHIAMSAYILWFDRYKNRTAYLRWSLPCLGIWFSTIYLRYHYFTDVVAGFGLAYLGIRIAFTSAQTIAIPVYRDEVVKKRLTDASISSL